MVTPDGNPVVPDFELAHDVDSAQAALTVSGDILGTLAYISQERIAAKRSQPHTARDPSFGRPCSAGCWGRSAGGNMFPGACRSGRSRRGNQVREDDLGLCGAGRA